MHKEEQVTAKHIAIAHMCSCYLMQILFFLFLFIYFDSHWIVVYFVSMKMFKKRGRRSRIGKKHLMNLLLLARLGWRKKDNHRELKKSHTKHKLDGEKKMKRKKYQSKNDEQNKKKSQNFFIHKLSFGDGNKTKRKKNVFKLKLICIRYVCEWARCVI